MSYDHQQAMTSYVAPEKMTGASIDGNWHDKFDCKEYCCALCCGCCLIGNVFEAANFNYWTNCCFASPIYHRDRIGDMLSISREKKGFFHTDLGACAYVAIQFIPDVGHMIAWLLSSFLLSEATQTFKRSPPKVLTTEPGEAGGQWPTGYCDMCADGFGGFLYGLCCTPCAVASAKTAFDDSPCFWNCCFVPMAPLREHIRHELSIAPGPCCSSSPCCADCLPFCLPCGALQTISALKRGRALLQQKRAVPKQL